MCGATVEELAKIHAGDLAVDAGDKAVLSGDLLLGAIAAGCGWKL